MSHFFWRGVRWLGIVAIVWAAVSWMKGNAYQAGFSARHITQGQRGPNTYERFYATVAVDMDAPELCGKIFSGAVTFNAWAPERYQALPLQVECLSKAAFNANDLGSCGEIVSINAWWNEYDASKKHCVKELLDAQQGRFSGHLSLAPDVVGAIFEEMGFEPQVVAQETFRRWRASRQEWEHPPEEASHNAYRDALNDADYLSRVDRLPTLADEAPSQPLRPANRHEILYSMIGVDRDEPAWCEKISPIAYRIVRRPPIKRIFLSKSDCLMAIAINTGNAALCQHVQRINVSQIRENKPTRLTGSSQGVIVLDVGRVECMTRTQQESGWRKRQGARIDAVPHDIPDELAQVLQETGYSVPVSENNPQQLADQYAEIPDRSPHEYYWTFVSGVNKPQRAEFLDRVRQLPDFHE